MKGIFCLLVAMMCSCNTQSSREYQENFKKNKADYFLLSQFLARHKSKILNTNCDKTFKSIKQLNDDDCFPAIKDSLKFFFDKKIFQSFEFYRDTSIELLLDTQNSPTKDKQVERCFIYTFADELPDIYTHYKKKEKLDKNWWYVEKEDAYY